ncbi:MAG: tetratricopeptide repeat protein [Alphaproteobacteria bacterium]|nr:tetratricopeptide repeat protein [Alphaproteobacteria bacterium]
MAFRVRARANICLASVLAVVAAVVSWGVHGEPRAQGGIRLQQIAQAAQTPAALERERDELFERTLANPGDLDVALRYAQISVELDDLEAAVVVYERLLMIDPDLPRIRYELGFLYHRLGSFELARAYLTRALAGRDIPIDVRQGAQALLDDIGSRTQPHAIAGSVTVGFRYQTNANAGPASGTSRSSGQDTTLPSRNVRQGDWNAFTSIGVRHRYDFDRADDAAIDSVFNLYGARQFVHDELNLSSTELRSGVRFRPFEADPELVIRPHLLGGGSMLEDRPYTWQGGVGLDLSRRMTESIFVDATADYRYRRYFNHGDSLTRIELTGWEAGGQLNGRYVLTPSQSINVEGGLRSTDTRQRHNDYTDASLGAGYTLAFDGPIALIDTPWTLVLSINRNWTNYVGPDASIDATVKRRDRQWQLSGTMSVPITAEWSSYAQITAARYTSSLPNYEYDNLSSIVGLTRGF